MLPDKPMLEEDDDELALELPDFGEGDEEAWEPDDDSDLGVEPDEENLGLDSDVGTEEAADGDPLADEDDDGTSWLDDGRGPPDEGDDDELDGENDEYGLIEGSEPAQDAGRDDWENEELDSDDGGGSESDAGEEGFGDELAAELELEGLPPLDDGSAIEDPEADLEAEAFAAELGAAEGTDANFDFALDRSEEIAPGLRCTRFFPDRVIVETLLRGGRPLGALVAAGDAGIAWDGTLLVAEGVAGRAERRFAGEDAALALAAAEQPGGPAIALATPNGLLCSLDGGRSFAIATGAARVLSAAPASVALMTLPASGSLRFWIAAPLGPLFVSDDLGASFREVALAGDLRVARVIAAASSLLVIGRAPDGSARALHSDDCGECFAQLELPVRELERLQDVQQVGELSMCARRAPQPQLVVRARGGEFTALAAHASAPALLLAERDGTSAYFCVQTPERLLLVRRTFDERAPRPAIVCELESSAGAPLQLAGAHGSGITTLQLGTERAWYRVALRLDGGLRD